MRGILVNPKKLVICIGVVNLMLLILPVLATNPLKAMAQPDEGTALEERAKQEGKLRAVIYRSLKPLVAAFQKKYGIKVEAVYTGTPSIMRRVREESDAGIFATDVFNTSTGPSAVQLNKWALPYTPVGIERTARIKKNLPPEWNQTPIVIQVAGVFYHQDLVKPAQVPTSIYDLLKPEFKGKIIMRTPWLGSNLTTHVMSYFTWFGKDTTKWSDYWSQLKGNVGRYDPKFAGYHTGVGLKEFSLGIFSIPFAVTYWGRSYKGVAYSTFKEGGLWWANLISAHKNAPHPNAAKLFVNFLISGEGQKIFAKGGNVPVNKDIPPKASVKDALAGIELLNGDLQGNYAREISERGDEWVKRIQGLYK